MHISNISLQLLLIFGTLLYDVTADTPCCDDYCYTDDTPWPQKSHYATKTAYQIAKAVSTNNDYRIPNCTPKKVWLLNRHGTRFPTAKEMNNMRKLESLRDDIVANYVDRKSQPTNGALCDKDFNSIRSWSWNSSITDDQDQFLSEQGWRDLKLIALNYKRLYPDILNNKYDPDRFYFRYTNTQRTKASFQAFAEGLFGRYQDVLAPEPPEKDMLLRPYDLCPAWDTQSDEKKDPNSEYQKFIASSTYQKLISDVSIRLGFKEQLTPKQIDTMWDMCRYEQSWTVTKYSAWCAVFTKPQINIQEYLEDIKYYYKQGFGHELNSNVACSTVQNMLDHLKNETQPEVVAYFTHSSAVQLFLTALDIAKDTKPLRADNYEQMKDRNWRTSKIGPFAANFVAVKYECSNFAEKNKVMFFHNEKPVKFDWCKSGTLCDLSAVLARLKKFNDADCTQIFCTTNTSNTIKISLAVGLISIVLIKFFRGNF